LAVILAMASPFKYLVDCRFFANQHCVPIRTVGYLILSRGSIKVSPHLNKLGQELCALISELQFH